MKIKSLVALLLVALMLCVTACAQPVSEPAAEPAAEVASEEAPAAEETAEVVEAAPEAPESSTIPYTELKIGLLVPDSITEVGWSKQGADGAKLAEEELGCTVSVIEAASSDLMKSEAEALCDDGYQLIIGHGSQYGTPFSEICGEYPDVLFLTLGGSITAENLHPIRSDNEKGWFMLGALAALSSKTNKTAAVISGEYSSLLLAVAAYRYGARYVNPDIEVIPVALSAEDVNECYEMSKSLIQQGCDVIMLDANSAIIGGMNACQEEGVLAVALNPEWPELYPDTCACTLATHSDKTYPVIAKAFADGTLSINEKGHVIFGYEEGQWDLIYGAGVLPNLVPEAQDLIGTYYEKLKSGEVFVPTVDEIDQGLVEAFSEDTSNPYA